MREKPVDLQHPRHGRGSPGEGYRVGAAYTPQVSYACARVHTAFEARFGGPPSTVARAPGRVNLIGEHTDYNDGYVLPMPVALHVAAAASPRDDQRVVVVAADLEVEAAFDLEDANPRSRGAWIDYIQGVAVALGHAGARLRGASLVIGGDVPRGAGLSSSAALEVAATRALLSVSQADMSALRVAQACQQAENTFVGARCGIMDQFAASCGTPAVPLLLDCRTLEWRAVCLPPGVCVVICDSGVRHALADGAYNERREDCERGAAALRDAHLPRSGSTPPTALRDATAEDLERLADRLPPRVLRRCRHVVLENQRVTAFAAALENADLPRLGALMAASHRSLADLYEVSCPELDALVEISAHAPGHIGARMTGAGFGGCTVHLVESDHAESFCSHMRNAFAADRAPAPGAEARIKPLIVARGKKN